MRYFFFFSLLILFVNESFSQISEDVVYLKNGSVLRGDILENIQDSIVKLKLKDGNIWVFKSSEVLNITKEKPYRIRERYVVKKVRYNFAAELGTNFPLKGSSGNYMNLGMVHSYNLWPDVSLGAGISFDFDERTYVPVFIDAKYYWSQKYFSPVFSVSAGKAFPWDKKTTIGYRKLENKGGYYFLCSLGVELPMNEDISFMLMLAYRYQRNRFLSLPEDEYYELLEENNRIAFKVGLLFH